jgi:Mg2+ and Co2+ transporter CorA
MPFDTHQVFKHLKRDNVFTEEQADRLADALSEMDVASATTNDLQATEKRLRSDMEAMEERIKREITNRLYGTAAVVTTVLSPLNYLIG